MRLSSGGKFRQMVGFADIIMEHNFHIMSAKYTDK